MDYAHLKEVADQIDWSEIIKSCNVEDDWVAFMKVIIDIRDKYIPKRVIKLRLKQNGYLTKLLNGVD